MQFDPGTLDKHRSPVTGLTRESWQATAKTLLTGILANVHQQDDPIHFTRREKRITYPHDPNNVQEQMAERFEGLARSFFIAAPLLKETPMMQIGGRSVLAYYKYQILHACTPNDPLSVGDYATLMAPFQDSRTYQQTVETGALVIGLWISKAVLWDTYTPTEQATIADFVRGYAEGNTINNNWQLFNMLDLAWLEMMGYSIDRARMHRLAQNIADLYAGDGWYRDGHTFDYYTAWGFNLYAPIWNLWYGNAHEPALAARFAKASNAFIKTFPAMFDREGHLIMWGRSAIYRNGVTAAFFANCLLDQPACDPGLARRISSGALAQFYTRDDTFVEGVPSLGFYRQFSPLIQGYSCAESPLWSAKAFLCLYLPATHPFWQAQERNGVWTTLTPHTVKETCLDAPGLLLSQHSDNGLTMMRTGKVVRNCQVNADMWHYARLSFNSALPWEATPTSLVEAQQYVLQTATGEQHGNVLAWGGQRAGVLYRKMLFDYQTPTEYTWLNQMDLADFPVVEGILRVDRPHLLNQPYTLRIGADGFPDNDAQVSYRQHGDAYAVIVQGHDHTGNFRQLAMTAIAGFESVSVCTSTGTNADSEHSLIPYAIAKAEAPLLVSQELIRTTAIPFSDDELFPVTEMRTEASGTVTLLLHTGTRQTIDFSGLQGCLSL